MKQTITALFLTIFSLTVMAQDDQTTVIQELYDNQKYDEIINGHASKAKEYSAKTMYYIGMAYYMKADDNNCIKYMNMSIDKDPSDPDAHYIKGMTYNYMGQFDNAIKSFNKAIEIHKTNGEYYSGLGDSYFNLDNLDKALETYQKATKQENAPDRSFSMLPQIYNSLNQKDKALEAFYIAKEKISKETDSYINVLYNIGLLELIAENYEKAEKAFIELVELAPNDYHSYAKLIQIHYARKQYDKAERLRKKLYDAHRKGLLIDNMKDMFCFDQFKWNDKLIQVFEKFAEPEGELYYKHLFYVVNKDNEIEYRIQTENSVISVELGGPKYILGMDKGDTHSTFNVGFNEDFKYDDLKSTVIEILEGKLTPGASSRPGNK